MKTIIYNSFIFVFSCFFVQTINAQDPNWAVNSANYQYSMTFTAFLNVNGTTLASTNDKVAAFVNGEIRGVAHVEFVASVNKYVSYLSVYANSDKEIISFKIYNSSSQAVVNTNKTAIFSIDGNLGGISQSYSIANPELNENAVFNSFKFLGITAVAEEITSDKITIVLPKNTNLNSLTPVFNSSVNSKVFVAGILQESESDSHDFTNPIVYKILSENEANLSTYTVKVTKALNENPTTVAISTSENVQTNTIPVALNITFSKVVSDFEVSDFVLENAVISSFSTLDSQTYNVAIIPISQGDFSAQIPAGVSFDENNNKNESSNKIKLTYNILKPIISSISVEKDAASRWFLVTFTKDVLNVDTADFELIGSASSGLTISNVSAISANLYKIEILNSNSEIGVVSLQLKSTSDIKDFFGNTIVLSEFEAFFLNTIVLSTEDVFSNTSFSMYPNPTSDFIKLKSAEIEHKQIFIYDTNGKEVFSKKFYQKEIIQEIIIDVKKLKTGLYFLKLISKNGNTTKKIIKI